MASESTTTLAPVGIIPDLQNKVFVLAPYFVAPDAVGELKGMSAEQKVMVEREKLVDYLDREGEILSAEHPFQKKVVEICKRLEISDKDQIYGVDTEDDGLAFYGNRFRAIALGKGIFNLLQNNGLTLSEDHIAAVLAHELVHSQRKNQGDNPRERYQSALKYNMAGHNQEYEADRKGMMMLARAGYNPNAMVEIISHFNNLKDVNYSTSHPEDLNRVNHLKGVLFDDTHPLANTDKAYTPLDSEIAGWIAAPSETVYQQTERRLEAKSSVVLKEKMLGAENSADFLEDLKAYKHAVAIERANAIKDDPLIEELVRKSLALRTLMSEKIGWEGKVENGPTRFSGKSDIYYKNPDIYMVQIDGDSGEDKPRIVEAGNFRKDYGSDKEWEEKTRTQRGERWQEFNFALETTRQKIIQENADLFGQPDSEFLDRIDVLLSKYGQIYTRGNIDEAIDELNKIQIKVEHLSSDYIGAATLIIRLRDKQLARYCMDVFAGREKLDGKMMVASFPTRDREIMDWRLKIYQRDRQENHQPLMSDAVIKEMLAKCFDLKNDPDSFVEGLKCSVAIKLTGEVEVDDEIVGKYSQILGSDLGVGAEVATIMAQLLIGKGDKTLIEKLTTEDVNKLAKYFLEFKNISTGRLSPTRENHQRYKDSLLDAEQEHSPWGKYKKFESAEINSEMAETLANEILSRGQKEGVDKDKLETTIDDYNLTLGDWKLVYELSHYDEYDAFYRAKAISEMVTAYKNNSKMPDEVLETFDDIYKISNPEIIKEFPLRRIAISPQDLELLLDKRPWGFEDTNIYIQTAILKIFRPEKVENEKFDNLSREERLSGIELATRFLQIVDRETETVDMRGKVDDLRFQLAKAVYGMYLEDAGEKKSLYGFEQDIEAIPGKQAALLQTLTFLTENGIIRNLADLTQDFEMGLRDYSSDNNYDRFGLLLLGMDESALNSYGERLPSSQEFTPDFDLKVGLVLMSLFEKVSMEELLRDDKYGEKASQFEERILVFLGLINSEVHPVLADRLLEKYGEEVGEWIVNNIHNSYARDRLFASLALSAPQPLADKIYLQWMENGKETIDPDNNKQFCNGGHKYARSTSRYRDPGFHREINDLIATTEEEYRDILTRRHPFAKVALRPADLDFGFSDDFRCVFPSQGGFEYKHLFTSLKSSYERVGNQQQRLIAEKLMAIQEQLIDPQKPFEERMALLEGYCPVKTVVRDIHLERMIRAELGQMTQDPETTVEHVKYLLEYFASHEFMEGYVGSVLDVEMRTNPDFYQSVDEALGFVTQYLKGPSLQRNHYLSMIENNCNLTVEQAESIRSLKMTEELEGANGENFYFISVADALTNQANRDEKREQVLWLMKMMKDKPDSVIRSEKKLDGVLDSAQTMFFNLKPEEREAILKRFLLGNQGVIDLSQAELYSIKDAEQNRRQFFDRLAIELIPDSAQQPELFRKIFVHVLEKAEPVRSAQIVIKLINTFADSKKEGSEYRPEQALSTALCTLGVVGKKADQSLSEQPWVPDNYRLAMTESQENADQIPKSSLVELSSQNGLLEANSPVRIVSFNQPLGSASNKQAEMVEVQINDPAIAEKLGIKVGETVELVGKFKRPSAQKIDNIAKDIELLGSVMKLLEDEGVANTLPSGFAKQIETTIKRELNFAGEVEFNQRLAEDMASRPSYRGYQIGVPEIVYATDDIVLEQRAEGESLRKLIDRSADDPGLLKEITTVKSVVLRELMNELMVTGDIHADLHPGNVFVDVTTKTVTFIDLGMNVHYPIEKTRNIRDLMMAMVIGSEGGVADSLSQLGWEVSRDQIKLEKPTLGGVITGRAPASEVIARNLRSLVDLVRSSTPPEEVGTLIFAASKLEPYFKSLTVKDAMAIMVDVAKNLGKSVK